ncbi:hypothetical protein [Aeromicrobium sp. HA]|uniref:hypothetical protein n=1 Tax=Aeromicrobium sp. HA TaxID=3009077 RepID=UPI0022AF0948|nr:hypothetical protein [Aeromicrobium sp. HA]
MTSVESMRTIFTDYIDPFPFVEVGDAGGEFWGYGHQDAQTFVTEIARYDRECGSSWGPEGYDPSHVEHLWAVEFEQLDGWTWEIEPEGTENAFPITRYIQ